MLFFSGTNLLKLKFIIVRGEVDHK